MLISTDCSGDAMNDMAGVGPSPAIGVTIAHIAGKGRGLVARDPIPAGQVIERTLCLAFSANDRPLIDKTALQPYYFVQPQEYQQQDPHCGYMVLGLSSFCNHSEAPNARVDWKRSPHGLWAQLTAAREIDPGEEILIRYANIQEYDAAEFV